MPLSLWKDPFRVNALTDATQWQPDVVGLSNGNILVVWSDENDTAAPATQSDILGQIYDPFGDPVGATLVLNEGYGFSRDEYRPRVDATDDGGFVITYTFPTGGEYDHIFRRFDADGTPTINRVAIDDTAGGTFPSQMEIVYRPDGSSIMVYRSETGLDQDILAIPVSATGTVGAPLTIRADDDPSGSTNGDPTQPAATVLSDGRVVIAYLEEDGNVFGVEQVILGTNNSVGSNLAVASPSGGANEVDVAALADGGWVTIWQQGNDLYGRTFNSDGSARTGSVGLATGTDIKGSPSVVGLREGGFALTWIDYSDSEISTRVFDANALATAPKVDIAWQDQDAYNLEMTETDDGRLALSWYEFNSGYSNSEIYSAILDPRDGRFDAAPGGVTMARHEGGRIDGTASTDEIHGQGGVDLLYGNGGKDNLFGGGAADDLYGGSSSDLIRGQGGLDDLFGGRGGDRLYGGTSKDRLYGGDDNDRLYGGSGADSLYGGDGPDSLFGGAENDRIVAGGGHDSAYGGTGADRLIGKSGRDEMYGDGGNDRMFGGAGYDKVYGGNGADVIFGGANGGSTGGGPARDLLIGGDGNDRIYGGGGEDWIRGNDGRDLITGGADRDLLVGGANADVFIYRAASDSGRGANNRDAIRDFEHGVDLIDLSAIDADTTRAGNQAFTFIGLDAFGDAGDLRARVSNGDIFLLGDRNGDGVADFEIELESPGQITTSDFIL